MTDMTAEERIKAIREGMDWPHPPVGAWWRSTVEWLLSERERLIVPWQITQGIMAGRDHADRRRAEVEKENERLRNNNRHLLALVATVAGPPVTAEEIRAAVLLAELDRRSSDASDEAPKHDSTEATPA